MLHHTAVRSRHPSVSGGGAAINAHDPLGTIASSAGCVASDNDECSGASDDGDRVVIDVKGGGALGLGGGGKEGRGGDGAGVDGDKK